MSICKFFFFKKLGGWSLNFCCWAIGKFAQKINSHNLSLEHRGWKRNFSKYLDETFVVFRWYLTCYFDVKFGKHNLPFIYGIRQDQDGIMNLPSVLLTVSICSAILLIFLSIKKIFGSFVAFTPSIGSWT